MVTSKTKLNSHLKKKEIKENIEKLQKELIELQTLSGNELENYYMQVKALDDDALTMFWKPKQAAMNAEDGHSMIQAAVDGYKDVMELLTKAYNRVQSANDTFTDDEWVELQNELNEYIAGIKTIARFTEYNGKYLIDGNYMSANREPKATFLVGVHPKDVVTFTPSDMNPSVLGESTLSQPLNIDGKDVVSVFVEHFSRSGMKDEDGKYISIKINSTELATIALTSIDDAILQIKNLLVESSLTQQELIRIKGFMEMKAEKGEVFLSKFKSDRAQEIADELENLSNQLELVTSIGDV